MSSLEKTIDNINKKFGTNFSSNFANRLTNAFYTPKDWYYNSPSPGSFIRINLQHGGLGGIILAKATAIKKINFLKGEIDNINEYEIPRAKFNKDPEQVKIMKDRIKTVQAKIDDIYKYLGKKGIKKVDFANNKRMTNAEKEEAFDNIPSGWSSIALTQHDYKHSSPHPYLLPLLSAPATAWALINNAQDIRWNRNGFSLMGNLSNARGKISSLKAVKRNILLYEIPLAQKNKDFNKVKTLKAHVKNLDNKIAKYQIYYNKLSKEVGLKK